MKYFQLGGVNITPNHPPGHAPALQQQSHAVEDFSWLIIEACLIQKSVFLRINSKET